jgi:CPA2 family monovalent cation:H+ antiporter-2
MEHILFVFITTIFIATILNVFLKKYDMPTVIGYIFSGLIITHLFKFNDNSSEVISHLAEFGIVFLMFTIGLEFSINHLKSMKKEVFVFGFLQVMVSGIVFSLLANFLFSMPTKTAIVLGFALSLSSTAIVLKVLNESNDIHSGYGRVSLGVLLFQDLAVIPILLMISIFTSSTDETLFHLLSKTLLSAVVVFIIIFIAGKYFIERFFNWITSSNSEEIFLVSVLLVVMSASVVAELFGFSFSLGAFLAGMTIAETKYRYRIEADLIPFRDILLGVFFVSIGIQIDLSIIVDHGLLILFLVIFIMLIKGLILFLSLKYFVQNRTALKSSLALFQVGEFALAIFALAFSTKLISSEINQIMIITVVLSMIITPFVLKNIKYLADLLFKEPEELRDRAMIAGTYQHHVIICGYGPVGKKLAEILKKKHVMYVILEHDINVVDKAIENGENEIYLANAAQKSILEHFNVKDSLAIITAIKNEHTLRLICENISSFGDGINSIVKVKNESQEEVINDLKIKRVINGSKIITEILAKKVLECKMPTE